MYSFFFRNKTCINYLISFIIGLSTKVVYDAYQHREINVEFSGTILDKGTHEAIVDAEIFIDDVLKSTTNSNGQFVTKIDFNSKKIVSLEIAAINYEIRAENIYVEEQGMTNKKLFIEKQEK